MSEQPERGPAPPQRGGKKILGLPRGQAIGLGLLGLGGLAFLLWRARKNAQKAQQAQAQAATCPDGSTPDANGNCPQNSQDYSGAIDTLQSEIAALQGAMAGGAAGGSAGGSAGTVAGSTGTPTTAGGTTGTPGTAAPGSPAAGTPIARIPGGGQAGPVSNLRITSTGTTGFAAAWNAAQGATGGYEYMVRDLATHQQVGTPHQTRGTIAVVSGLKPRTDYNLGVQGLPGGPGANIHVRTR